MTGILRAAPRRVHPRLTAVRCVTDGCIYKFTRLSVRGLCIGALCCAGLGCVPRAPPPHGRAVRACVLSGLVHSCMVASCCPPNLNLNTLPHKTPTKLQPHSSVYKTHVEALHFAHIDKDLKVRAKAGQYARFQLIV